METNDLDFNNDVLTDDLFEKFLESKRITEEYTLQKQGKKKEANEVKKQRKQEEKILNAMNKIETKKEITVKVPVNKDGTADALFMGSIFGKSGLAVSSLANSGIEWTYTKLYLREQSIAIDLTGESVLYSDIKLIEKGKVMNIFLKNGDNLSIKLTEQEALKRVIESKMESNSKTIESKTNFDGDKLIKYAEMLENGLITKEEFITLKNNLK